MNNIFSTFPLWIFVSIFLGLILHSLLIGGSMKQVFIAIFLGCLGGCFILLPEQNTYIYILQFALIAFGWMSVMHDIRLLTKRVKKINYRGVKYGSLLLCLAILLAFMYKEDPNYDLDFRLQFLPFSWLLCVFIILLRTSWNNLRHPVDESTFPIITIAVTYSTISADLFRYYLPILAIMWFIVVFTIFYNKRISKNLQFLIVSLHTISMIILYWSYFYNFTTIYDGVNMATLIHYFIFGMNALFIGQQLILLSMLIPDKSASLPNIVSVEARTEYRKHYATDFQVSTVRYFIFLLTIIGLSVINYYQGYLETKYVIGILFTIANIPSITFVQKILIKQK